MKGNLLLPSRFKMIGWITFLIFVIFELITEYLDFQVPGFYLFSEVQGGLADYNLTNEFIFSGLLMGLLMICFAKHRNEDEYITRLRLDSWQWSVLISYILLIIVNYALYGLEFFVFLIFNTFSILVIFIIRFYYSMYKLNRSNVVNIKS